MTVHEHHLGNSRMKKRVSWYDIEDWEYIRSQISDYNSHDCFDAFCIIQFRIIRKRLGKYMVDKVKSAAQPLH